MDDYGETEYIVENIGDQDRIFVLEDDFRV